MGEQMAESVCIACTGVAVARVLDGAFRKPVCAVHRRLYSERGYLLDALLIVRASTPGTTTPRCLCGVVDDRGDGTCGNCGLGIADDEDGVSPPGKTE